jgi:hypothetical protein
MGIAQNESIGDEPFEMGDGLIAIQLPTGKTIVNLWVSTHVVVLFDDHTMTFWGDSFIRPEFWGNEFNPVGSLKQHMGDGLHIIHPGIQRKPVQVMLNRYATIVLFDNGDVVGLGINREDSLGQCTSSTVDPNYYIGIYPRENGGYEILESTALIYFSSLSPNLYVKGLASNSFAHFCVITYANEVICWGVNDHGQLGLGHSN